MANTKVEKPVDGAVETVTTEKKEVISEKPKKKVEQVQKPTLYELTQDYLKFLEFATDPDCDEEVLRDTFYGIDGSFEDKADNYAKVLLELAAKEEALDKEIKRLTGKKKTITDRQDWLKKTLQASMELTGKEKFETNLFKFWIQPAAPSVLVDESRAEDIPFKYLVPQPAKVDKKAIKDDLLAIEKEIEEAVAAEDEVAEAAARKKADAYDFATLVRTRNLRIK